VFAVGWISVEGFVAPVVDNFRDALTVWLIEHRRVADESARGG
jgi:hypothetical protein